MARELADGVWLLDVGLVPPLATNAFLLDGSAASGDGDADGTGEPPTDTGDGEGPVTLVDTGLWWNRPGLLAELSDAGYEPTDLDRVCLTHYDLDHITGLGRLLDEGFDGPVYMGRRDVELVRGEWDPPLFHHKGAFHRLARRLVAFPDVDLRPVDHGDRFGGCTAYHTPGHNHGHVVYLHEGLSVACLGDLVWEEGGRLTTPFWLDSYEMRRLRESVRRFVEEAPDFEVAAMAHGTPFVTQGHAAMADLVAEL
jgi:glyoxylase-like metal-dependent hydrolase (beta-lactamase superfamily II)